MVLHDINVFDKWCHNKFALRIMCICTILPHTKIILWMKYVLRVETLTRTGYI